MKTKSGNWISTTLLFLSVLVLMAVFISIISLSITQDAYALGGLPYIGSPTPPPYNTPPPLGTPTTPIVIPHTIELVGGASDVGSFITYQDNLYFNAYDPIFKEELFQYDGNSVSLVADLAPDGSSAPTNLTVYDGKLYFVASGFDALDNPVGRELFSYDGSTISLVADIMPGEEGSSPHKILVHNGELYFIADGFDAENNPVGEELFKYDGSQITLVKDFYEGPLSGGDEITRIVSFENNLYFSRRYPSDNRGTFKLVGTDEILISEVVMSSATQIEYQGALYFGAYDYIHRNIADNELFRLVNDQIQLVADIYPGYYYSYGEIYYYSSSPDNFVNFNNEIYFEARDNLYKFNGSTVSKIVDEFPWQGHPTFIDNYSNITKIIVNSDSLIFRGRYYDMFEHALYYGIYYFNGERVEFIDSYMTTSPFSSLGLFQEDIFFNLDDGSGIGTALWMLDTDPGRVTHTTVTLNHPAALPGEPVEVQVAVSAGDGALLNETVDVGDGTGNNCQATLVNGVGSCSLTFNDGGDYTIYARYPWGGYYFSSSHEADLWVGVDETAPTGSFTAPVANGSLGIPRSWLIVEAADPESGILSVEFQAYYGNSWHSLSTDTDPSDGWRFQWETHSIPTSTVKLRAIVTNKAGLTNNTIQLNNITLSNSQSVGGIYESRESSETPKNIPEEYLLPDLPYPYLITPY